jgi:hypothetical protein
VQRIEQEKNAQGRQDETGPHPCAENHARRLLPLDIGRAEICPDYSSHFLQSQELPCTRGKTRYQRGSKPK